jgi:hypothetical protein
MVGLRELKECRDAREAHLVLRDVAGLPPGGEIHLKDEVVQIAQEMGIPTDSRTKNRITFEVVQEAKPLPPIRSWDEAKEGCRSYDYITACEAEWIARYLHEQEQREEPSYPTPPMGVR